MPTDKNLLNKGISFLAYALPMFFIGPAAIYNAFQNQDKGFHYVVLAIGIAICVLAVYFAFRGLATIVRSMTD